MDLLSEITWVEDDLHVKRGAEALAAVLQLLAGWSWAGSLLLLPGMRIPRRAAYRLIARRRLTWFGQTCETGACTIANSKAVQFSKRIVPACFSLIVLVFVLSPILQNFRSSKLAQDSFPLSYYPMFSKKRDNAHQQVFVAALRPDGSFVPIHYRLLGSGGLNQTRRQLGKLVRQGGAPELESFLQDAAERVLRSTNRNYADCVSIAVIKGTYELDAYFSQQNQEPIDLEYVMKIPLLARGEEVAKR